MGYPFDVFRFSALVNGLAHERARQPKVRVVRAYLIGFSAWETGHAERVIETKTLINLRIDPEFRPLPEPRTEKECRIDGLLVARRRETVATAVGRVEAVGRLHRVSKLAMNCEALLRGWRGGVFGPISRLNTRCVQNQNPDGQQEIRGNARCAHDAPQIAPGSWMRGVLSQHAHEPPTRTKIPRRLNQR